LFNFGNEALCTFPLLHVSAPRKIWSPYRHTAGIRVNPQTVVSLFDTDRHWLLRMPDALNCCA